MRVGALVAVLCLAVALLAGCAQEDGDGASASDQEFRDLDLQATSTTGILRGIVVDEAIRPLPNVAITLSPGGRTTRSTDNGTFGFEDLDPGTYFVSAAKPGFGPVQSSAEVLAGIAEPPRVRLLMTAIPGTQPYVEVLQYTGFIQAGVAVFATSVGTTTYPTFGDQNIFVVQYTQLPQWAQGELVWEQTQAAGGAFIWEMTDTSNTAHGHRETTTSPALAYWNTTVLEDNRNSTLDPDRGIAFRIFGGPMEACQVQEVPGVPYLWPFGCGVTLQQRADVYIHDFYNFTPPEGWRFTKDGAPVVPA